VDAGLSGQGHRQRLKRPAEAFSFLRISGESDLKGLVAFGMRFGGFGFLGL